MPGIQMSMSYAKDTRVRDALVQSNRSSGIAVSTETATKASMLDPIGEDDSRDDHKASKLSKGVAC